MRNGREIREIKQLEVLLAEVARFKSRVDALKRTLEAEIALGDAHYVPGQIPDRAAMKRASMDLTRMLADVRRSKG